MDNDFEKNQENSVQLENSVEDLGDVAIEETGSTSETNPAPENEDEIYEYTAPKVAETPSKKDAHERSIPVPGGDNEKPHANGHKEISIPIPNSTNIDAKTYNEILGALQKSYKESAEIIDILLSQSSNSMEDKQEEFTEAAILASYEDGPLFESVDRSDKEAVKKLTREMRPKVKKFVTSQGKFKFYNPGILRTIFALGVGRAINNTWSSRLWQQVGIITAEEDNAKSMINILNKNFKDDLGEYKFISVETSMDLIDVFSTRFGWKNVRKCWLVLIDRKLTSEIKSMADSINSLAAKTETEKK